MKARIARHGLLIFVIWSVVQAAIGLPIGVKVGLATLAAMQTHETRL